MAGDTLPMFMTLSIGASVIAMVTFFLRGRNSKHVYPSNVFLPLHFIQKMLVRVQDFCNSPTTSALIIQSSKQVSVRHVQKAAMNLMKRHRLLRSRIYQPNTSSSEMYFVDMGSDAMERFVVTQIEREDWQTVLENDLLQRINHEAGPLWSLSFMPNVTYTAFQPFLKEGNIWTNRPYTDHNLTGISDEKSQDVKTESVLVFSVHHGVADGTYRTRLLVELEEILDHILAGTEVPVIESDLSHRIADHISALTWREMILMRLACVFKHVIPSVIRLIDPKNAFIQRMGAESARTLVASRSRILPVEWSREFSKAFVEACKRHGCTVQGALNVACGVAVAKVMSKDEVPYDTTVGIGIPVNLRPHLKDLPLDAPGVYFGALETKMKFSVGTYVDQLWTQAIEASRDLHRKIKSGEATSINRFELGPDAMLDIMISAFEVKRKNKCSFGRFGNDITIVNMGRCVSLDIKRKIVHPRALFWATPEHNIGPLFSLKTCTFNERVFCTLAYYENITSRNVASKYLDFIHEVLVNMVSG